MMELVHSRRKFFKWCGGLFGAGAVAACAADGHTTGATGQGLDTDSDDLTFNVRDFGALGDGSTDDSGACRSAIAAASAAGGGTVMFPNGTYLLSEFGGAGASALCLDVPSGVSLRGQSRTGAVLMLAPGQAHAVRIIRLNGSSDVTVSSLTLDGNKGSQDADEHRANMFLWNASRVVVRDVESRNASGDAIDIFAGCQDVLVEGCLLRDCDRDGVAINGGGQRRITIHGCQIVNNVAQQVDTEPEIPIYNITVENCHLVSQADYALTISGGAPDKLSVGFTIVNNVIEGAVYMVWAKDVLFLGNDVETRPTELVGPIAITRGCEDVLVEGNRISNQSAVIVDSRTVIIVEGASGADKPKNVKIVNNVVACNDITQGVSVNRPRSITISGNEIVGGPTTSGVYGIEVRGTDFDSDHPIELVRIVDNRIVDFGPGGLVIWGYTGAAGNDIDELDVTGNIFEKRDNPGMFHAMDLNYDGLGVVQNARVHGNVARGTTLLGGVYGGWPATPTLVGGNRGDGGSYSLLGSPEGVITEVVGATAVRRDGASGAVLYVKESGAGNTGWVAK